MGWGRWQGALRARRGEPEKSQKVEAHNRGSNGGRAGEPHVCVLKQLPGVWQRLPTCLHQPTHNLRLLCATSLRARAPASKVLPS